MSPGTQQWWEKDKKYNERELYRKVDTPIQFFDIWPLAVGGFSFVFRDANKQTHTYKVTNFLTKKLALDAAYEFVERTNGLCRTKNNSRQYNEQEAQTGVGKADLRDSTKDDDRG
jgi:hypothetical protein